MLFTLFFADFIDFIPIIHEECSDDRTDIGTKNHHNKEAYVGNDFNYTILYDV